MIFPRIIFLCSLSCNGFSTISIFFVFYNRSIIRSHCAVIKSASNRFCIELVFFENVPSIYRKIATLNEVGLSYIKLGQPSTTLSGGEAQRVKLATELSRKSTGKTIYILDEPTTGLHFADVHKLVEILRKLSDGGNTVIVIEHNLDVIKTADYIIDIGPEGGDRGGTVIATGTPEEIVQCDQSYTGKFLKKYLED